MQAGLAIAMGARFKNAGEFFQAVAVEGRRPAPLDERLRPLAAAPGVTSSEAAGADGGYASPPAFVKDILAVVASQTSILGRCRVVSDKFQVTVPIDPNPPWKTTGAQVYWAAEGGQATASKVELNGLTLKSHKLIALVPVTDELLDDAQGLESYLTSQVPIRIDYRAADAILNGTGAGVPRGIVPSPAAITVNKDNGQSAKLTLTNVENMLNALYAPCRQSAVFVANPDLEPLMAGFGWPFYKPGPVPELMGFPVLFHEAAQNVGTVGDIVFADFSQYLVTAKTSEAWSMHVYFDSDVTAYRFILRFDGEPGWKAPIARAHSSSTASPFVLLQAR